MGLNTSSYNTLSFVAFVLHLTDSETHFMKSLYVKNIYNITFHRLFSHIMSSNF